VGAQQLARRGDVAPVGQPLAGALDARVGEGRPQPRGVVGQRVRTLERLAAERVFVVDVGRADRRKGGAVAPDPRGLPAVDELVDHAARPAPLTPPAA
jgi:hypothetical protein